MVIDNPNNTIVSRKQSSGESLAHLLPNHQYGQMGFLPSLLYSILGSAFTAKQNKDIEESKMDAEKKIIKYRYDEDVSFDKKNTNYTKDILTGLINNYIGIPVGKSGYINPILSNPDIGIKYTYNLKW